MSIIGRKSELRELENFYESGRPEFLIIYGRRRVGKTFLIREYFRDFTFYFTGSMHASNAENLSNFDKSTEKYGGINTSPSKNWFDAFEKLEVLLKKEQGVRKVVFIDEMPWLDKQKSGFLTAFDYFWNSFASANSDILFIGCGSATSWITKKIFQNKGGLHNRITGRIYLAPFTLSECEEFFAGRNIAITRQQLAECYMIFGGIPYYLNLFSKDLSFSQNVDKLCFAKSAPLKNEFNELYYSIFNNPQMHISIITLLMRLNSSLSRNEICKKLGIISNERLTNALNELEQCDFIERFSDFTTKKKGAHYFAKDPFSLFYLRYMKDNDTNDDYFWTNNIDDGSRRAWSGYAFELLCRIHIKQIKAKLGISGVSTSAFAWRSKVESPGAQIDLVISRKDGVINLCEMKFSKHPFEITKDYAERLERKKSVFSMETNTKSALHTTLITTYGLVRKGHFGVAQAEITMDDLFN